MREKLKLNHYGVFYAWVIALVATMSSLYLSEIEKMAPCSFCWYQRIFMFPLAIILGVATYREDRGVFVYAFPLSVGGGIVALYHYFMQHLPFLKGLFLCNVNFPCSTKHINYLGFLTIPFFSLLSFLFISLLLWASFPRHKDTC